MSKDVYDLVILPGDGIGLEVMDQALKALEGEDSEMGTQSIDALLEACDSFIPEPERPLDKPFLMPVEDVFTISGRGTVTTGRSPRPVSRTARTVLAMLAGSRPHSSSWSVREPW